ncbi:hypothetical protein [Reyranella sp.]|uniref:hypothetical protein n=1 Tax=Reyranella sp. TaxID=1929291 RepID=UPI00403677C8
MRRRLAILLSKLAGSLITLLLAFAQPSSAQSDADWAAGKAAVARESIGTPEGCQNIWEFYWRWAKNGSVEARVELWKLISLGWLKPPGLNQDTETLLRHHYTLLIHNIASGEPVVLEAVERMVTVDRPMTQSSAKPYLECVRARDKSACVGSLVQAGLVADFDAYARELDMLAAAPDAKPASCPDGAFHFPRLKK